MQVKMKPSVEWLPTREWQMHETRAINGAGGSEPPVGGQIVFNLLPQWLITLWVLLKCRVSDQLFVRHARWNRRAAREKLEILGREKILSVPEFGVIRNKGEGVRGAELPQFGLEGGALGRRGFSPSALPPQRYR